MRIPLLLLLPVALLGQAAPSGNAKIGKELYRKVGCYQCHGYEGQGGRAGSKLAPRPVPFLAFVKYTRQPADQMPPYTAKVLTDNELADIYAFLQSIPAAKSAKDIPLLNR